MYTGLWWGNLRDGDHLEGPGVDGSTKMDLQEMGCGSMDCMDLTQMWAGGRHL